MSLAAVLLIATVPQTTVTPSSTLFCQQVLGDGRDEFSSIATLETNQDQNEISSFLAMLGPGYRAEWNVIRHGQTVEFGTASLDVKAWPLPKGTRFPITVDIKTDGISVGRFTFDHADVQIVDMADRTATLTYFPAVQIPTSFKPQRLWGAATIELLTTDSRGQTIDTRALKGPDWHAISAFADRAFTALEAQRAKKGCRPHYSVMVVD